MCTSWEGGNFPGLRADSAWTPCPFVPILPEAGKGRDCFLQVFPLKSKAFIPSGKFIKKIDNFPLNKYT